jgi:amino-acid N-acetyltransferase
MLRPGGKDRIRGRSRGLLWVMVPLLEPSIRRGEAADLPAVLALLEAAGLPTADLTSVLGPQMWVLEAKDSVLGVIALERFGSDGLLRSLAVAPECRKRGFGHKLVARLEHEAQAGGVEQLVLLTETAEPLFRSLGYGVIDRRHVSEELKQSAEFRSLCPASAVCMSKALHS